MPRKVDSPYKGTLAEPMRLPSRKPAPLLDGEDEGKDWREGFPRFLARIDALFAHFGIDPRKDPDPFVKLALALAIRHVPGFRIQRNAGRPLKWSQLKALQLWADVQELRSRRRLSERAACSNLPKNPRYKGAKPETLHRQYKKLFPPDGPTDLVLEAMLALAKDAAAAHGVPPEQIVRRALDEIGRV